MLEEPLEDFFINLKIDDLFRSKEQRDNAIMERKARMNHGK